MRYISGGNRLAASEVVEEISALPIASRLELVQKVHVLETFVADGGRSPSAWGEPFAVVDGRITVFVMRLASNACFLLGVDHQMGIVRGLGAHRPILPKQDLREMLRGRAAHAFGLLPTAEIDLVAARREER